MLHSRRRSSATHDLPDGLRDLSYNSLSRVIAPNQCLTDC